MRFHFGNMEFSTNDQDNDGYYFQCSRSYKGAWWYKSCNQSKLNGLYLNGSHLSYADGVNWLSFRGHRYSLKRTKTKVKTIAWDNVYPRIKRQSNQGFNIPPRQHTGIWLSFFPGGEELEPCMGGVGYLNRTCFTRVLSFNMELFKGKEFTFASRYLTRKGLQESHSRWSCLL